MQANRMITLAMATLLGTALLAPVAASAQMRPGGMGGHLDAGNANGSRLGGSAVASGPRISGAFRDRDNRFAFRDRDRDDRRFAFRDHFRFRHRLVFAAVGDDGCFRVRRIWTPFGWKWRRIWVCG